MNHEAIFSIPQVIRSVAAFNAARALPPDKLIDHKGDFIKQRIMKSDALPVLICAHNEEAALPLLLTPFVLQE